MVSTSNDARSFRGMQHRVFEKNTVDLNKKNCPTPSQQRFFFGLMRKFIILSIPFHRSFFLQCITNNQKKFIENVAVDFADTHVVFYTSFVETLSRSFFHPHLFLDHRSGRPRLPHTHTICCDERNKPKKVWTDRPFVTFPSFFFSDDCFSICCLFGPAMHTRHESKCVPYNFMLNITKS